MSDVQQLVVGFLGSGDVSDSINELLIRDVIKSARGRTVRFVVPLVATLLTPAMEVPIRIGLNEPAIAMEAVIDGHPLTGEAVEWAKACTRVTTAADVPMMIVSILERAADARLLVYWHEDDEPEKQAIRRAIQAQLEVRDLCEAYTRLDRLVEPTIKENPDVPTKTHTDDEIRAMDEDELAVLAPQYGIDHESIATWNEVAELIIAAHTAAPDDDDEDETAPPTSPTTVASDDAEGFYTLAEVTEADLDTLKKICKENEIDVPGQRPRHKAYVEAIRLAQGGFPDETGEAVPAAAPAAAADPAPKLNSAPTPPEIDIAALADAVADKVLTAIMPVHTALATTVGQHIGELASKIDAMKPVTSTNGVAAKALGVKKLARRL